MKTNKILLGGIAGAIVFFFLGWIIWGMLLSDFMQNNYDQSLSRAAEDMIWWALILANLASGFMFALIIFWSDAKSIAEGAKIGGIIGVLLSLSMDLSFYAMSTTFLGFAPVIVDVVIYAIVSAIAGAAIVWAGGLAKK